jgi:alcohol dehydrogenase
VWSRFKFRTPDVVHFGYDSVQEVGNEAKRLGADRVLVLCDPGVAKAGLVQAVDDSLRSAGVTRELFDQVEPEPSIQNLNEAVKLAREGQFGAFVGVGGGSSMDMTKMVGAMVVNQGSVQDYFGVDQVPRRGKPTILVTTTSGTGSEVTRMAVFTDTDANLKKVVSAQNILADVAVIDPSLTLTMPQNVTADTGIDAFIHAAESYIAVNATPLTETLALQAIEIITQSLGPAFSNGNDRQARYNMALGSMMAGITLNNAGVGAAHALAYPLGAQYHLSHGKAMTVILAETLRSISIACLPKFARMAQAMGVPVAGLTPWEAAEAAVQAVVALMKSVRLPTTLVEVNADRAKIKQWSLAAHGERRLLGNTPRNLTVDDIEEIFTKSF